MTEKHCKEFFGLFAAYLEADKNAAYSILINSVRMRKNERQKKVRISTDVNELTPQMRHIISRRMCNNAQDETNVGEKEKQTDEASNRERGKERDSTSQRETPGDEA